jgi:hypothetical protein
MLLLRGVPLLTLGVPADAGDATAGHTREATRLGLRYRELLELPTKLIVFGRHTALLPLDPDDAGRGAVELTDHATVAALVALFLRHWERAYEPP